MRILLKKLDLLIEIVFIFLYLAFYVSNIPISFLTLSLGIFCILFLPGYNLISILKPDLKNIEKLGYSPILSIAIGNIFMIIQYLLVFDKHTYIENEFQITNGFIYNGLNLVLIFQVINIVLIIGKFKMNTRSKTKKLDLNDCFSIIKRKIINNFNIKLILCFLGYIYSIVLLLISTQYSNVPENSFGVVRREYRSNLLFFLRVPLTFYVFLVITIIFLIYIILFIKNKYLTLISFSIFLYCLWILPYLQIKNYFNYDTYYLYELYEYYLIYGISNVGSYGFCLLHKFGSLRYSTNLLTAILLTSTLKININTALWYVFPLIYCFIPFFFYSFFNKYKNTKEKHDLSPIILSIFILFTPYFTKNGHNASTGLLGIILFLFLIVEFYEFAHSRKSKLHNYIFIFILFLFLCLTHFEECIYFISLIALYLFIFTFQKRWEIKGFVSQLDRNAIEKREEIEDSISNKQSLIKGIKIDFFFNSILMIILFITFYLITLFFGYLNHYYVITLGRIKSFDFLLFIIRSSVLMPVIIISINILYVFLCYLLIFKFLYPFSNFIYFIFKFLKRVFFYVNKMINSKIFQIVMFPLCYLLIVIINITTILSLSEPLIIVIVSLIITYTISISHLFMFLKGLKFFSFHNSKQNYYFLAILASGIIIFFFSILGSITYIFNYFDTSYLWMSAYILHSKYIAYFAFSSIIIIQNNYFRELYHKRKRLIHIFIIVVIVFGIFSSLRALRFG